MAIWCRCKCHGSTAGNINEQKQRGNLAGVFYFATEDDAALPPMVAINDQLEVLVAIGCRCCEDHVRLKTFNPPPPNVPPIHLILPPPNPFDPTSDSQSPEGGSDDDTD